MEPSNDDMNTVMEDTTELRNVHSEVEGELFKKPVLFIGPRKGLHKFTKIKNVTVLDEANTAKDNEVETDKEDKEKNLEEKTEMTVISKEKEPPLSYKEPNWSGQPNDKFFFEVLKSGSIIEEIDLCKKSYFVFGRLTNCDIIMAHPSVSRHHAVLQYRAFKDSDENELGFYLYDLGSTHGTFLNKNRIRPNTYVRVRVGHMIKIGLSSRYFILQGPDEDQEEESEHTVTELKELRLQKEEEIRKQEVDWSDSVEDPIEKTEKNPEDTNTDVGVDWGLGEDADEETDLSENPYAVTQNEELYINDPKKTLRGWFEREGYELVYDCEEKGFGQFVCRVELPIDNSRGTPVIAEAVLKGKKKESVVQCALEACRILDQYGLLRQAKHESKKRKAKNWEENDYYDSDEDTFLDRTGAVEKKRQHRMKQAGKSSTEVYTYQTLIEKHKVILSEMKTIEDELSKINTKKNETKEDADEDALDKFMSDLSTCSSSDGTYLRKIKMKLTTLKEEEVNIRKLANIAKPAEMPELKPPAENKTFVDKKQLPLFGKRKIGLKKSVQKVQATEQRKPTLTFENQEEYESDSD